MLANFDDILSNNPHRANIQGFYTEMPLSDYQTFVPNGSKFPDRYGHYYDGGQFDAPLFTLEEWRDNWEKGHPDSPNKPDLLVNANWFNVWESGIPNQGGKINPRKQARTFIAGLSISRGELTSTHKVMDQNNVGLDAIVFDIKNKTVKLIPHHHIDIELENNPIYYKNKNAVSGFIILNENKLQKTPDLNNNHSNRLPRTGVGYKNDGKDVTVMVIHHHNKDCGVTAEEFANLFLELNCTHAINLDNSGSVEMHYKGPSEFGKKEQIIVSTKTCDSGTTTERPKPNCLGFGAFNVRLFSHDDSDIPVLKKANNKPTAKTDHDITYTYFIKR